MGTYAELYDFAAGAGAFEGYVYKNDRVDPAYLPRWSSNLVKQYQALPAGVRAEIQTLCDGTVGRAVLSLIPLLGEKHEVIRQLEVMIQGKMPSSPDDFDKH